jgi:aminopeptidase N
VSRTSTLVAGAILAAALVAVGVAFFVFLPSEPGLPGPGIAEALAADRAARISDLRYEVTLTVPAARAEPIRAHLRAGFELADATRPLAFDFAQPLERLLAMHANANIVAPNVQAEHVIVPPDALVAGHNIVEFDFLAGEGPLNRQDDFLYALFVPARASQAMPVFDQPNLKARWKLVLNLPRDWVALTNGAEIGRVAGPDHLGLVFEETPPIPTYLFAFIAGRFSVETAERGGRRFRMLHRETDAKRLARNREAIFDLHASAIAWLEDYTSIPYPFPKFEFALIPSFQFGGMEHPGAVYYNASSLLLDESATQTQQLGRASLVAHETAHMWFGDLVTMAWFNDVWMKEVFANFMAARIVNPSFPGVNHDLRFLLQHYPAAYEVDRTDGANPIRQPLSNLNDAGSLYGAIIYQKAPIVMRLLERIVGTDGFRDGLRAYLTRHAFGNATWSDLIAELDGRTDADLASWSRAWVEERGRPRIVVRRETSDAGTSVSFEQNDPLGRGLVWRQHLELAVGHGDRVERIPIDLGPTATLTLPASAQPPRWILPTSGGLGYGDFVLEISELDALASALPSMPDPLLRGATLVTLWESMLEGRLPPARMAEVLQQALPREADELNTGQMLDYLRSLFWRYTAADDRESLTPAIEPLLRDGLGRAKTTSQRAAWFQALRSVATTRETVGWLERVWRRDVRIPGLPLAETDEADLALELAVREVPASATILDTQLARFENADRKARFAFVMPALSASADTRDAFFETLKNPANRRREAWVLEAMRYLHHPLRAASSRRLVIDALMMTREIKDTGDIFFPKRWVDAALSGYQSPQTAADVRRFIDELPPDYPERLRWVLLASADPLFRAARILHQ